MLKNLIFALLICLTTSGLAHDETSPLKAHLTSSHSSITPGQDFELILDIQLDDGWHAYWKNPGDSGMAPSIHWNLPDGITVTDIDWPTPERFQMDDVITFGYSDTASFLIKLHADKNLKLQPFAISGDVEWIICSTETCLPGTTPLKIEIQAADESTAQFQKRFDEVKKALPENLPHHLVEYQTGSLLVSLPDEIAFNDSPQFFPEKTQDYSKLPKVLHGMRKIEIPFAEDHDSSLKGVLVLGEKAYTVDFSPKKQVEEPLESLTFFWAIVFAFLGGLILNLMPCVLPVVSLKVMSFVKMAGDSRKELILHGLGFTLGVLVSFWILAGALIALQATGQAVGWGFQLQDPLFISALALLFLLLGLNLFGVFELGTGLANRAGVAQAEKKGSGVKSSFWSGVFATAVATPCTGPFMGSALGYALTQPAYVSFAIFTTLGIGMSVPYLLLGFFPSLIRWFPKPGAWMESFKQFLGFIMLASVIWLLWVFNGQTSELGLFLLLFALLIASLAAWVYGRFGSINRKKSVRIYGCIIATFFFMISLGITKTAADQITSFDVALAESSEVPHGTNHAYWEPFSAEKVAVLRQTKQPVLIDFTAKWCLICQANHLVMTNKEVTKKFTEHGVTLMKADWTRYDPVITEALKKYGRSGVPLYVLYGEADEPVILPQVLTPDAIISALEGMKKEYVR